MNQASITDSAVAERVERGTETAQLKSVHIAFSIKRIGDVGGGAEKVLAEVANGLRSRGYRITVICGDRTGTVPYYHLHPDIKIQYLDSNTAQGLAKVSGFLRGIGALWAAHKSCRPDVAVSFMHSSYIAAGIALVGTRIPLIASEHIGPEHYRQRPLQNILLQITPLLAKQITVVSEQIRLAFNPWLRRKMCVVHNPVNLEPRPRSANHLAVQNRAKVLLSVGRLTPQKNQNCLIAAFALIADRFPDWTLRIAGEGPLRMELESQVKDLRLTSRVILPGNIADIGSEYAQADLFVLPSSYESFGLATAEAIMHGLPAVGFADCPGTNTLIRPGENGVLVHGPDKVQSLAEALAGLMGDPEALRNLQNAPTAWLQEVYAPDAVLDAWERLIAECAAERMRR
jgi:GalNAc-alpha-(1->4)-GalNAc-alpha-(1->3)-diNAcBac-PP-undecaprenol alpha-1,4-N-acetyl-D-galactosaminyltransferase